MLGDNIMAKAQILIVEDENTVTESLQELLKNGGYSVAGVASAGEEAIKKTLKLRPDLVLMDIKLKGDVDGVEAARQIHESLDIPIIFLTGYADNDLLERAKITEPYGYLLKPFVAKELRAIIEMSLYKHKMERKLRETEQWYATTLRCIGDAVITTDARGLITYMNTHSEALTGWEQKSALGKELGEILKVKNAVTDKQIKNLIKKALCEDQVANIVNQMILITRDGRKTPIESDFASIKDDKRGNIGVVIAFRDITESKRAEKALEELNENLEQLVAERTVELEEANNELVLENDERKRIEKELKESEERFHAMSASAQDAIVMINKIGEVSFWNRSAERIFGFSREEIIGKNLFENIFPDSLREAQLNDFRDSILGSNDGKTVELVAVRKNRTEIPIELSHSSVKIHGKWNAICIVRNISERKQMEKDLRESYKIASIGRLTSNIFHEILNPVNIISSHVQLLLMDIDKGSLTEKDLNSIQEELSRIEDITNNILTFSKEEEFATVEAQMNNLLEIAVSQIESDTKLSNIKFISRFEEGLPKIMLNGEKIKQVFLNLISNACAAMPEGGIVTINTQSIKKDERPFIRIIFTDTGCGIARENIDKLFEPFFSTKSEVAGVGLGLSESYGIIRNHGGIIGVESEVRNGTTFTIDLPIERRKGSVVSVSRKARK